MMVPDDSRIYAAIEKIKATVSHLDEAARAAAEMAAPDGPGFDTLLAALESPALAIDLARPELVTDSALARILGALKYIEGELDSYVADRDVAHLVTVLGYGIQNLYAVLRHCFGYWQLPRDPHAVGMIKRLCLQLGVPSGAPRDAYPVLQLLLDGIDELALVGRRRYHGFPPAEVLGPDAPLLPAEPARHVPLYVETGGGPSGGCVAALIHTWGDYIAWNDFRRFDSVYTPSMKPRPDDGQPCGRPQVFDGVQYRAAVHRATTERAWESPPWLPHSC